MSAKFGDGKTYLLNELRKDEAMQDKYEFFTIYPVNYSVAKNEDVFEYIKRDIIVQLHKKKLFENIDLNTLFGSVFTLNDLTSVVPFLLSLVPLGELCNEGYSKFLEIKKKYDEKKHIVDKYLSQFANTAGCIHEEDGYTKLIKKAIKWISQDHSLNGKVKKAKKPVLIIEDLDRLDPKHLFRILNVVSAHIDDSKQPDIVGNKFGFNNIVLVMDYDVTKHIFHHFYGEQACYEGYMSKFLSREPFRYSIGPYMVRAFEEQLGEKLGIKNLLPHLTKFRERLVRCSLRDLYKLIRFDTDSYFKVPEYCYSGGSMPTSLPLFHLIIYMMESGMSVKEIQIELDALNKFIDQNFNGYLGEWEIIRLMYPVYITQYPKRQYIKVHNSNYHFWLERTKEGGNVIINKADKLSKNSPIISIEEEDIGKIIKPFIEYLSIFVNLSALRLD